jgi:hypothetical protein
MDDWRKGMDDFFLRSCQMVKADVGLGGKTMKQEFEEGELENHEIPR